MLQRQQYFTPFGMLPGITVPAGDYRYWQHSLMFGTPQMRLLSANMIVTSGGFLTGRSTDYVMNLNWRPSGWFGFYLNYLLSDIKLPQGDFVVRVPQMVTNFSITPDLSWNVVVQHDNVSNAFALHTRMRYMLTAGSDLFFVLDKGADTSDGHFNWVTTDMVAKLAWTIRF